MNIIHWPLAALLLAMGACATETQRSAFEPKIYAFENGVRFGSSSSRAKVLKELGYDGVSQISSGTDLASEIAAFDGAGLDVLSVYLHVNDEPIDADAVAPLANRGALIELTVGPVTPRLVEAIRQTAQMASQLHIRVALYPHFGNGVATMPEAMDLIDAVGHDNLGVMFNLCHFLKSEKLEDLEQVIEQAGDRLFAVSTNGADVDGASWQELIQPLGQGDFPQARLLRALRRVNFKGPVTLQCFGLTGDQRTHLESSSDAWRKSLQRITGDV